MQVEPSILSLLDGGSNDSLLIRKSCLIIAASIGRHAYVLAAETFLVG